MLAKCIGEIWPIHRGNLAGNFYIDRHDNTRENQNHVFLKVGLFLTYKMTTQHCRSVVNLRPRHIPSHQTDNGYNVGDDVTVVLWSVPTDIWINYTHT